MIFLFQFLSCNLSAESSQPSQRSWQVTFNLPKIIFYFTVSTWLINIQMVPMKLSWGTINEFDTLLNWFSGINQILKFSFCVYSVTYCDNKFLFMTFTRKNTGTQSQYLRCCFYQWVLLFSGVLDLRLKLMEWRTY